MITREIIAIKLKERLARHCSAIQLTHWAKGLMFDYFEKKKIFDPEHKDLVERAIMRIANASTNYRTFLFDSEILKILSQFGDSVEYQPPYPELYAINIILGQPGGARSQEAVTIITTQLSEAKHALVRQQGSGILITADHMSETEINHLANALNRVSFIMSLKDYQA